MLFARAQTTHLICTPSPATVSYSNFVSNTSLFHAAKKNKSYYCFSCSPGELVTSMLPLGLPPLQALALFQTALFHLNFNPIYGLSYPPARPRLSNYSSSRLHVTRPCHKSLFWDMCGADVCVCVFECVVQMKGVYVGVCLW